MPSRGQATRTFLIESRRRRQTQRISHPKRREKAARKHDNFPTWTRLGFFPLREDAHPDHRRPPARFHHHRDPRKKGLLIDHRQAGTPKESIE